MEVSENLISLVYLSAAVFPFQPEDLLELLGKSQGNNQRLGITGMLLFKQGNFLQVLEGERETVLARYKRIVRDPRHRKITTVSQEKIVQRDFPGCSMGFRDLGSLDSWPEGFTPFLEDSLTAADFSSDPSRAKRLLLLFKEETLSAKAGGSS
jgi:hypothetical protein